MDEFLFGSSELADQAFKLSVTLFERIIEHITTSLPEQDVSLAFVIAESSCPFYINAEPI